MAENAGPLVAGDGTAEGQPCIRCEYDLTGLGADTVCPECGVPAALSRKRSKLLRGADRAWLAGVRRGLRDLELAMTIVMVIIGVVVVFLFASFGFEAAGVRTPGLIEVLWSGLLLVAGAAGLVLHVRGCVLISRRTHADYALDRPLRVVLGFGGAAMVAGGIAMLGLGDELATLSRMALSAIYLALQILTLAFFFALARALRTYERRTEDWSDELAQRYRNVDKNLLGVIIIIGFSWLWMFMPPATTGLEWGAPFFALVYVFFVSAVARVRRAVEKEMAAQSSGSG